MNASAPAWMAGQGMEGATQLRSHPTHVAPLQDQARFNAFAANLDDMAQWNAQPGVRWFKGINEFRCGGERPLRAHA